MKAHTENKMTANVAGCSFLQSQSLINPFLLNNTLRRACYVNMRFLCEKLLLFT